MKEESVVALRTELEALDEFLASPGYRAAKKITDSEIQDGIDVLVDFPIDETNPLAGLARLLEARGEVRALKKFTQRFVARKAEINQILEKQVEPVDEDAKENN